MRSVILLLVCSGQIPSAEAATLDEAVVAAQARSHTVGFAHQQHLIAKARLEQARFTLLPSIYVSGAYTVNQYEITMDPTAWVPEEFAGALGEGGEPTIIQEKDYVSANLRVDQTLFDARTLPGLKAARENRNAAHYVELRAGTLLRAQVAQMAHGVQAAREATLLAKRGVAMAQVQLDLAEARKELGGSSRRDHLQAKLALSRAKRDLRSAEEAESGAELAFSQLTGFDRKERLDLKGSLVLPDALQAALEDAKLNRTDLLAATST